jgi:DNA invertase Pin-like site-specific DNA recombinase
VEIETGYSMKDRHQLALMKDYVREDDTVFVECLDRLGRNSYDLDEIVEFLLAKGVQNTFVREGITLGKKNDLMSKLAYDMMKSFIHFFSALAKERQRIGIDKAMREGRYKGRATKLDAEMIAALKAHMLTRKTKSEIAKDLGVSRETIYRYLNKIAQDEQATKDV